MSKEAFKQRDEEEAKFALLAQRGNESAFALLVGPLTKWIEYVVRRMGCSADDAEEVVGETWVKIVGDLSAFSPERASVRVWVATIARRTWIDMCRRRRLNRSEIDVDLLEEETSDMLLGLMVDECLAMLSEDERRVIRLSYFEGLTDSKVAVELSCDRARAYRLRKKGLAKLQFCLERGKLAEK